MRTQTISFPEQEVLCIFPEERSELLQAVSELRLSSGHPVIVLIGGKIDEPQAEVTRRAVQTIAEVADNLNALVLCGGTDMGVMAEIGQLRWKSGYTFPLIGIAPEKLVTWDDGPHSTKFLWWGTQRWELEPHYSNFILVPGDQFGDESPWIIETATLASQGHKSITVLINGGEVSRKDIDLSLEMGRPVIALSRTGRLADEYARQPHRPELITVVPANAPQRIKDVIRKALSVDADRQPASLIKALRPIK